MFSVDDREKYLQNLTKRLQEDNRLEGAFLFGSGVTGYTDGLSDIDVAVAVKDSYSVPDVFASWESKLAFGTPILARFTSLTNRAFGRVGEPKRFAYYVLFENYLEMSVSFRHFNLLSSADFILDTGGAGKKWRMLFDVEAKVNKRLCETQTRDIDIAKRYIHITDTIWYYIVHATICIQREQFWRAVGYLDDLRNYVLELSALQVIVLRPSMRVSRLRLIPHMPEDLLSKVSTTIVKPDNKQELLRALKQLVTCFFDEAYQLEELLGLEIASKLHEKMTQYIELVIDKS